MATGQFAIAPRALGAGTHQVQVAADLVQLFMHGSLTPADVDALFDIVDGIVRDQGYALILADCTHGKSSQTATRRLAIERLRPHTQRLAVATYGLNAPLRAMLQVFSGAVRLFASQPLKQEIFQTELDARAWLDVWRQRMRLAHQRD